MDVVIRLSECFHIGGWSWETDRVVNAGGVTLCRYDDGRWRPLCQCQHNGGGRAGDVGKGGENHCGSRGSQAVEGRICIELTRSMKFVVSLWRR